jgi:hypothetical protein
MDEDLSWTAKGLLWRPALRAQVARGRPTEGVFAPVIANKEGEEEWQRLRNASR